MKGSGEKCLNLLLYVLINIITLKNNLIVSNEGEKSICFDLKFTPLGTLEKFSHLFTMTGIQKSNYRNI